MRDVAVVGVGMTKFGKYIGTSAKDLGRIACLAALKDANISPQAIQVGYCGNAVAGVMTGQTMALGQLCMREVGVVGIPITNIENACSSGSTAFREGWMAVASGMYDVALALGVEKLYASDTGKTVQALAGASDIETEGSLGLIMPGVWALRAVKHMEKYGTTIDQLAKISVKNHNNGCLNPFSQYQKACTVEEVHKARMIADPLTVLHCSPIGDGAAAAVLCSKEIAHRYTTKPITVAAAVLTSGTYDMMRDLTANELETRAAKEAYEFSGIGPEDISLAEVHDCFTIAEVLRCESLGLCPKGEYGRWIDEGKTEIGGKIAVNPSGGLLAKGHPVGATGVAQVVEVVWHLRGEADKRQVKNAKVGLTHCSGGAIVGDTAACSVTLLKK
jgi:acetyl-CoA acetyltransferase